MVSERAQSTGPRHWPLKYRLWKRVHNVVNRLAWRYGMEPGWRQGMRGSALHINKQHWAWRLNDWVANHWVQWWMQRYGGKR